MPRKKQTAALEAAEAGLTVPEVLASYERSLKATRKSPRTVVNYLEAARRFAEFLRAQGMPQALPDIRREHVEAWLVALAEEWAPATVANRYRSLRLLFKWAEEEGEIDGSPMLNIKAPREPERIPPVATPDQLRALLKTCEAGRSFIDRRDYAILRIFITTGARRNEVGALRYAPGLEVNDVDLAAGLLRVTGKGDKQRYLPMEPKTLNAVDRYLRARRLHPRASLPALWLSTSSNGAGLQEFAFNRIVMVRCEQAGLPKWHPHIFRHTFAHAWQAKGGSESGLMDVAGWESREMVRRYGKAARHQRALSEHARLDLHGDV